MQKKRTVSQQPKHGLSRSLLSMDRSNKFATSKPTCYFCFLHTIPSRGIKTANTGHVNALSYPSRVSALQVSWDAQAAEFKAAIETLSNVEEVEVTKDQWTDETGYDFYRWTVRTDGLPILCFCVLCINYFQETSSRHGRRTNCSPVENLSKDLRIFLR